MTTRRTTGFTLIELVLSISFLGTLLVFSTMATVQAISIYNKGLAIKQINQAGRSLVEDINRLSSSGFKVNVADNGSKGYLCVQFTTNTRAYVWNSLQKGEGGTAPGAGETGEFTLGVGGPRISLARTDDAVNGSTYCDLNPLTTNRAVSDADVTTILTSQIQVLSVDIIDSSTPGLKKVAFWIGTSPATSTVVWDPADKSWSCEEGGLGEYCAVSKFETILYTPSKE